MGILRAIFEESALRSSGPNLWHPPDTVVPRLTTIIRSRKITVKRKHRKTKIKSPLKCIENLSVHSNGLKTHSPAKSLHTAAILAACIAMNPSLNTAGSHFSYPVAILKLPISCLKIIVLQRIGFRSREPISSQCEIPPFRPSFCDRNCDRKKIVVKQIHCNVGQS